MKGKQRNAVGLVCQDCSSVQIAAAAETEKLVQQCTRWIGELEKQGKITYMFRGLMQHQGFTEVQAVANAAVPIVKMIDARGSGLHVDICFNNMLGVVNTRSVTCIDQAPCSSTQVSLFVRFAGMIFKSFLWTGSSRLIQSWDGMYGHWSSP